jgi:hypothetical protein
MWGHSIADGTWEVTTNAGRVGEWVRANSLRHIGIGACDIGCGVGSPQSERRYSEVVQVGLGLVRAGETNRLVTGVAGGRDRSVPSGPLLAAGGRLRDLI